MRPLIRTYKLGYYLNHPEVIKMKKFNQHGDTSTYEHSLNVMIMSLKISDKLHLKNIHKRDMLIGALLHDFYLYDYHGNRFQKSKGIHCFSHPEIALHNAMRYFDLSDISKNIINTHMFPSTVLKIPKYKEAWIVTLADKCCAIIELFKMRPKYLDKMSIFG